MLWRAANVTLQTHKIAKLPIYFAAFADRIAVKPAVKCFLLVTPLLRETVWVLAKYKLANFGRTRGQIALGETIFSKIIVIFGRIHRRSVFGFIFF